MNTLTLRKSSLLSSSLRGAAICLLSIGLLQTAHAQDDSSTGGKWVIGLKAAQVEIRGLETDSQRFEEADAYGIVLGYEFNKNIGGSGGTASFELEYLDTDSTNIEGLNPSFGEFDAEIINAYVTYRSAGKVFFKIKGGVSYADVATNFNIFSPGTPAEIRVDDFSLVGGIGVGARIGERGIVELEYTADSGDLEIDVINLNALITF